MQQNELHNLVSLLKRKLTTTLPGAEAQELMAPSFRNDYEFDKHLLRESGVLLLLYPKNEIPHFVLMKRSPKLRTHSGQISLPGGKKEPTDPSFYDTAVRETNEELGVEKSEIEFLGELTPLFIPISNFMVYPYVAFAKKELVFQPNHKEVEAILEVPISRLLDERTITQESWEKKGKSYTRPFFAIEGQKVWGATAMIISEFRQLLISD